jgi:hypothetical protein
MLTQKVVYGLISSASKLDELHQIGVILNLFIMAEPIKRRSN